MTSTIPGTGGQAEGRKVPAIEVPKLWNKYLAAQRELGEATEGFEKADKRLAAATAAFDVAYAEYTSMKAEVHQ